MEAKRRKKPIKYRVLSISIILMIFSPLLIAAQPKHVAVPPDKMNQQKLPPAQSKGIFSHSTMLPINTSSASQRRINSTTSFQEIKKNIHFDGKADSPFVFVGPDSDQWHLTVTDPNGKKLLDENKDLNSQLSTQAIKMGNKSFKGKKIILSDATPGQFQVTLRRETPSTMSSTLAADRTEGFLLLKGDPDYKLYSYLDNNLMIQNKEIRLVAYMINAHSDRGNRAKMLQKKPLQASLTTVSATITSPSKKKQTVYLKDDGKNGDKLAGDGLYSAVIPSDEIGVYSTQVQAEGIRPDGVRFSRTTTDLYPIEEEVYRFLEKPARLNLTGDTSAVISIPVEPLIDARSVYLAAEVWGVNKAGKKKSAAWVGGVVSAIKSNNESNFELSFDTRWLSRNKIRPPYTLKALRLQTINNNVPIAALNNLSLITSASLDSAIKIVSPEESSKVAIEPNFEIMPDMLMRNAPTTASSLIQPQAASGSKLLLVHGYCSGNVWRTSDFNNSVEFKDYDQNRSHEDFAQRILAFGSQYSSYGIVAHSQGGAAALHLYTRYWSGLDYATGGRIIQSVGTPYQGTALAGNLAVLGEVFGGGCGMNTDLTYSGAANWLSTIPSWARSQVDYYTTSFATKWWRYDYCHLATDLFLDDPEDGTTEKWSGQLSGAANMGHKKGWCHTSGMRDTAQYYDSNRNSTMNSRAAR